MSTSIPAAFQKGFKPAPKRAQGPAPGKQRELDPVPISDITADGKPYKPAGKLEGKVALITGGDSGIGRSVAILYALEGADVTVAYRQADEDAQDVARYIEQKTGGARKVVTLAFDLSEESQCEALVDKHLEAHNGRLDILVLNHGTQKALPSLTDIPSSQWRTVFATNIDSFFYIAKRALPHLPTFAGAAIILMASVNPSKGHPQLLDYTATKGAIVGFGRALSNQVLGERGIRVNMVAPGPIWTPLIPASMTEEMVETFGTATPIGRCGQPVEVATCCVFLASADSSYMSGQVLHPNGGTVIG